MTDEEFERLKQAEKEQLRKKKRLQRTLEAVKNQNRLRGLVEEMRRGAGRLLQETKSLTATLQRRLAQQDARLEGALDAGPKSEEARREKRADELVRTYKAAESASVRSHQTDDGPEDRGGRPEGRDGPEKTIGRMKPPGPEDPPDEGDEA